MALNPNLDALIPREDFEVLDEGTAEHTLRDTIDISSLEKGHFFYESLRKPDFQRETANWPPEKALEFVRNFLDGDLVPAVILWQSQGNTFVIDGAHRLSALIAWVHDDYGDGLKSMKFFENRISPQQDKIAKKTRDLVRKEIGSYADYRSAAQNPDPANKEMWARAKRLANVSVKVQWVIGNAKKAEVSFFKINQSATVIDPTELSILKARKKPNALAARALMRAGTGHNYWSDFSPEIQAEIKSAANEVYQLLFDPALNTPVKTLDLPVAGCGYSADSVKLIFEFVNFANGLRPDMWQEESPKRRRQHENPAESKLADDADGSATLKYMKVVKRLASRISGNHPGSLGLHPAVYFYSAKGRYQPTAFLAAVALIQHLERTDSFNQFTDCRARFEEFLLKYRYFINQVVVKHGSGMKGLQPLLRMYQLVLEGIRDGKSDERIAGDLQTEKNLPFLKEEIEDELPAGRKFNTETKSAAFLREAIDGAIRCKICNARIHMKSLTVDHKTRKEDGGKASLDNAQLAHPYCNTGYKEAKHANAQKESLVG